MPLPPQKDRKPGIWTKPRICSGRDITPLQNYANNPTLPRGYLANLLYEGKYLEEYGLVPNLNECELSFAYEKDSNSTDWFGVYVTDPQGNGKYWFDKNNNKVPYIFYFKTVEGDDGYPRIDYSTGRWDKPPELANARQCVIKDGKCSTPPASKSRSSPGGSAASSATSTPARGAAARSAAPTVNIPSESLQAAMEALQIGPKENVPSGNKMSRDEAEKLDRKTMIQWMSANMNPKDILSCLESGALSAQDRAKINELRADLGAGVAPDEEVDQAAVRAMEILPSEQTRKMFKAITKRELIAELNAISNMNTRKQAIVELCQRAGLNYQLDTSSKFPKIIGPNGEPVHPDVAMNDCATVEARRAHEILARKVERAGRRARELTQLVRSGKYPAYTPQGGGQDIAGPSGTTPSPSGGGMTPTQTQFTAEFIDDLMDLLKNEQYEDFVAAVNNTGISIELRDDGIRRNGIYIDTQSEEMEDLIDEAALSYIKKYKVAFGKRSKHSLLRRNSFAVARRRKGCGKVRKNAKHPLKVSKIRSNFKCAAKKCKKAKGGYSNCMKTTLRKMYNSFGKKKNKATNIFTKAAKKCKGTKNYRKCMKKTLRKLHKKGSSFGKRLKRSLSRRESDGLTFKKNKATNIFRKAAKKCKGTKNYRKCMKKTLRKLHKKRSSFGKKRKLNLLSFGKKKRKSPTPRNKKMVYKIRTRRTHPKRKSPRVSATSVPVGTVKKGVDGSLWVVKKTKNGVKRWVKK